LEVLPSSDKNADILLCYVISPSETFGKALVNSELDGMFTNVLRQLLAAVLQLQEEEVPSETLIEELNG
jgi:hypothetical protein